MIKENGWWILQGVQQYIRQHTRTWESRCVRVVLFRQKRSEKGKNIRLHYFREIFLGRAEA